MKKATVFALLTMVLGTMAVNAQTDYRTAVGLGLDFGSGFTFVGPSAKFFLAEEHAAQAEVMFEDGITTITGLYQYHGAITGADGLKWFAGAGPSILFFKGGENEFAIRPTVGLDYKINGVPLAFSFDWRPVVGLGDLENEMGAFGLGFRYVVN
ncbi:MAG: hypothetical protein V7724_11950 [Sediminicola sp.]